VKVLAGDIVGEDAILASLEGLRADVAALGAQLDAGEEVARGLPHREPYLRLVDSLGRALLRVHAEWADEVESELGESS
jgi:hypothetical protein